MVWVFTVRLQVFPNPTIICEVSFWSCMCPNLIYTYMTTYMHRFSVDFNAILITATWYVKLRGVERGLSSNIKHFFMAKFGELIILFWSEISLLPCLMSCTVVTAEKIKCHFVFICLISSGIAAFRYMLLICSHISTVLHIGRQCSWEVFHGTCTHLVLDAFSFLLWRCHNWIIFRMKGPSWFLIAISVLLLSCCDCIY